MKQPSAFQEATLQLATKEAENCQIRLCESIVNVSMNVNLYSAQTWNL